MIKFFILSVLIFFPFALGKNCDNPLLSTYNFPHLNQSQNASNLNITYCNSLKYNETCCNASLINSFQNRTNSLLFNLSTAAAERDHALIDIRKSFNDMNGTLERFINASSNAEYYLRQIINSNSSNSTNSTNSTNTTELAQQVLTISLAYERLANELVDNYASLRSNFDSYQSARSRCVVQVVRTQAAAWCLACDPYYESKGVNNFTGQISLSNTLKQRLVNSCYDYLSHSSYQGTIFQLNRFRHSIDGMSAALEMIPYNQSRGLTEFNNATANPDETYRAANMPQNCTRSQCDWVYVHIFNQFGIVQDEYLIAGGTYNTSNRLLREEDRAARKSFKGRQLIASGWNPAENEAGVSVTFAKNPGNVDNYSRLIKSGVALVISMFVVLLN